MNTNKKEKALNILIPQQIKKEIISCATENHFEKVYRVAKWGTLEERVFISTYEEIQQKILKDDPQKYPLDQIGTYSTSVYTDRKSCDKFINILKRSLRKKYPCPAIICGCTSHGLVQRTAERREDADPTHIDWWIYDGKAVEAMKNFTICGQKEVIS